MKSVTTTPPIQQKQLIPTIKTNEVKSTVPTKVQNTTPTILSIPTGNVQKTVPPISQAYSNTNYNYNSGQVSSVNPTTVVHQDINNGQQGINNKPLIPKL